MKSVRLGRRAMSGNRKDIAAPADISLKRSGRSPSHAGCPPNLVQTNKVLICMNNCFQPESPLSTSFLRISQLSGISVKPHSGFAATYLAGLPPPPTRRCCSGPHLHAFVLLPFAFHAFLAHFPQSKLSSVILQGLTQCHLYHEAFQTPTGMQHT